MMPDSQPAATKHKRRWFQFSLRTLLVLLTLSCAWLGVVVNRVNRQRAAVQVVERLGGNPEYGDAPVDESWAVGKLRNWLPRDYFDHVVAIDFNGTQVSDAGLVHLKGLTTLEWLNLSGTQVTDAGLTHVKGLTTLKWLSVGDTRVTDSGLVHLEDLTALKFLDLDGTQVTDTGLVHLKRLRVLEWLRLANTQPK